MYSSKLKGISNVSCCFLPYTAMLVIFFGSFNHFHIYALHFCSTFYLWVFLIFTSLMIIGTVWGYRAHCRHHTLIFCSAWLYESLSSHLPFVEIFPFLCAYDLVNLHATFQYFWQIVPQLLWFDIQWCQNEILLLFPIRLCNFWIFCLKFHFCSWH